MSGEDEFWADVLGHLRQRMLVPVAGPELNVVTIGNTSQTLTRLIGQHLVERYRDHLTTKGLLTDLAQPPSMVEAVAAVLKARGHSEIQLRTYSIINQFIEGLDAQPGAALLDLAAITDFQLFVSTTPDRRLAQAVNAVRFHGEARTTEINFAPSQCTDYQSQSAQATGADGDTVVLSLFGQASPLAQYAIHDEDRLEWLHALLNEPACLPNWLKRCLKNHPLLFMGCDIPDWIGRFLLRLSSESRLSLGKKQFFFVGTPTSHEPALRDFFDTYCDETQIQHLDMAPTAFAAELHARWAELAPRDRAVTGAIGTPAEDPTIFISYMREDKEAARALLSAIKGVGGDAWMDERKLRPGDAWHHEILAAIKHTVRLFIPVISANTEQESEGYVFVEWREAVERARSILGRPFIIPVVIDANYDGDPLKYRRVLPEFKGHHFGRAPYGQPDHALLDLLETEIRNMRRGGAA